jgi:hypothetical protein
MNWPWNVRVIGCHLSIIGWRIKPPDYYMVEVRYKGKWYDAGTTKTWWSGFLVGLSA